MGSMRLPGKVLMDLGGEPVLARVVGRVRRASQIQEVVVATTVAAKDEAIVAACEGLGVRCFRGPEEDVLERYLGAAEQFDAEAVVRITSDCPLIDPELVDEVVRCLVEGHADYASNIRQRTYPRGLDAEAFSTEALRKAWEIVEQPHQREHVTPLFYERPDLFRLASVQGDRDYSRYRWTLDTPDDLRLIRAMYSHFGNDDDFGWRAAIAVMERFPELENINAHVAQKAVREDAQALNA